MELVDASNGVPLETATIKVSSKTTPMDLVNSIRRESKNLSKKVKAVPTEPYKQEYLLIQQWFQILALAQENPGKAISSVPGKPSLYDINVSIYLDQKKNLAKRKAVFLVLSKAVGSATLVSQKDMHGDEDRASKSKRILSKYVDEGKSKSSHRQKMNTYMYHVEADRITLMSQLGCETIHLSQIVSIRFQDAVLTKLLSDIIGDTFPASLWKQDRVST